MLAADISVMSSIRDYSSLRGEDVFIGVGVEENFVVAR